MNLYLLGLWLGDGDSDQFRITTMDSDIIDYLKNVASTYDMDISISTKTPTNKALRVKIKPRTKAKYTRELKVYKNGTFLNSYSSLKDLSNDLSIKNSSNVFHVISGKHKHLNGYTFTLGERKYTNRFTQFLKKHNLLNNKHIPSFVHFLPETDKYKLIAGLVDTDGTKSSSKRLSITQKNESIIDSLKELCISLQLDPVKKEVYNKKYNKTYYKLYFNNSNKMPILLERKKIRNV